MKCYVMEGRFVFCDRCRCKCFRFFHCGEVIGKMWCGECGAGVGRIGECVVVGIGIFRVAGGFEVAGRKFSSEEWIGHFCWVWFCWLEGGEKD